MTIRSEWIELANTLPEDGQNVLISNGVRVVSAAVHRSSDECLFNCGDVLDKALDGKAITHWMPLPGLPW